MSTEAPREGLGRYARFNPAEILQLPDYPQKTVEAGENFYFQDEPVEFLVILRSGRALTRWQDETTGRAIGEFFRAPSVIGNEALVGLETYQREAVALDSCTIQYIPRGDLPSLSPQVRESLLWQEVVRAEKMRRFSEAHRIGLAAGVAHVLLDLADPGETYHYEIQGLTQQDIGDMVGTSRENVWRIMSVLSKKQVIRIQRRRDKQTGPAKWFIMRPDLLSLIATKGAI